MRLITIFCIAYMSGSFVFSQQTDSLDIQIGQMILIGLGNFNQLDEREPVFQEVKDGTIGGVILFEKNISSVSPEEHLKSIIDHIQAEAPIPLFVSIDEEGGRVSRLKVKYGFPPSYSARYFGNTDEPDTTYFYAERTASILNELGINMNFAPCVDVNVNPQNPVIGKMDRSYSGDGHLVSIHAAEVIKAHDRHQVATVLKHFPGHGSSKNDTHLGIADVSDTWVFRELGPYKSLLDSGMVKAIMTAHIVNRSLDESLVPATLSREVVTGLLRDLMRFDGVVISDDMQMGAISEHYGLEQAIRLSILAGVDILMFANNVPDFKLVTGSEIHGLIREMVLSGEISQKRIRESYQRIMKLKANVGLIE